MIRLIELELYSFCNRKCKWCPNSYIDRQSYCDYIDTSIIEEKLLPELKEINYSGYITFSRYNEPLAHADKLKEIGWLFKNNLPNCKLVTNTNGDYLTEEVLTNLPIDELTVMDYDNKGIDWCKERLEKINCVIDEIKNQYIYAHYGDIKILYYADWTKHCIISNRGGNLPEYSTAVRTYPCTEPKYFIGINYDGTVSPCCNIRNDVLAQQPYIYGDLHNMTLTEILNCEKRQRFIEECEKAIYSVDSPCYYCINKGGRYTREKGGIDYE